MYPGARKHPARCEDTISPDTFHLTEYKYAFYLVGLRTYLLKYNGFQTAQRHRAYNTPDTTIFIEYTALSHKLQVKIESFMAKTLHPLLLFYDFTLY